MRSQNERSGITDDPSYRELRLLSEVHRTPEASQRDLSKRLGIALGLTNLLLRSLAEKGYVQITHAGWKRWLYALTPAGFSRKVHLTLGYIHGFLGHYQSVRQRLRDDLEVLALHAESRIAIYKTGDFAELVYLGLREIGIEEIDVFAPAGSADGKFLGIPVREATNMRSEDYDLVVVGLLEDSASSYVELRELGISPTKLVTFFGDHAPVGEE